MSIRSHSYRDQSVANFDLGQQPTKMQKGNYRFILSKLTSLSAVTRDQFERGKITVVDNDTDDGNDFFHAL